MGSRSAEAPDSQGQRKIGTLWTLTRGGSTAQCVLVMLVDALELRVIRDGTILRAECCDRHEAAFDLAECWRLRMIDRGWTRVVPGFRVRADGPGASG